MADTDRTPPHLVKMLDLLQRDPHGFEFYQAVRILDVVDQDKPPTGCAASVADDVVRFSQDVSMAFPPSTVAQYTPKSEEGPPRLWQRFLGMLGPQGPLPLHLTEFVKERQRDRGDNTFREFLNIFNHRMTALFYRAWARVRPTVSFDKPKNDRFGDYVGSLTGLGMPSLRNGDALPDLPKRHFAGLLACQTRHAEGLLAILSGYFCFPVAVEEFVGQWVELPPGSRCLMGGSSATMGMTISVGSHIWDCQQKFRIIIGPLTLEEYCRMLPGGLPEDENTGRRESLDALVAAVRTYVGDELDWDLQLILKKEETPKVQLGTAGRLGWTSWIPEEPVRRDPDDLILEPMERIFGPVSSH